MIGMVCVGGLLFDEQSIVFFMHKNAKKSNLQRSDMDIKILNVSEDDAQFLYVLMNDKNILDSLKEVPTIIDDWTDAISIWKCDPDEEDYIIFDEKAPIGWLGVNGLLSEDKTAYIKMIALLPPFQNQGVGSYVINQCLDNLKSRKYKKVILYTDQNNLRAQKCYEKCGFKITEEFSQKMSNCDIAKRYKMELHF